MGESLVRKRAKQFKGLQDAAHEQELMQRNLLSERSEVYATDYSCRPMNISTSASLGANVLIRETGGPGLEVVHGNIVVGMIESIEAASLRDALSSDSRCSGMLKAKIQERSALDGYFKVRCIKGQTGADQSSKK